MNAIKNIQNLSVAELFAEFLKDSDERFEISDLDYRNHIRKNTNDYDSKSLKVLYSEVTKFIEYQILLEYNNQIYTLKDLIRLFDDADYLYTPTQLLFRLSKIVWDNLLDIEYKNHDAVIYIRRYNCVFKEKLEELEFDLNENQKNILSLTQNKNSNKTKKTDFTFVELFKKEYQKDEIQSIFLSWLIKERYLNELNEIICDPTKIARLYYLLKEKGIVNPNINKTKAMRTYFSSFGVEVVESIEPGNDTPQVTRRSVTSVETQTTEMLDMTPKEKNTLLSIFKPN